MVIKGGTFELQMGNTSDEDWVQTQRVFRTSEMALKLT